ncbi:MAG: aldo/keto reductase [Bacilli bacterium]|nr:aldo/keto reductase [Bacilli bacterium]
MKNFGFGCMRLPMIDKEVDHKQFCEMIDLFMENGFTYYDTARVYIQGKSELALKECLVKRYPRESFIIADKLSGSCFEKQEDIIPFFNSQLESLGVEYIDYYLMHCQMQRNYDKFMNAKAYEIAAQLKKEGKIKHLGFSFHDNAEFLEKILIDHPEVEFVQIQFNYLDYDSVNVESKKCYEVCRKYNKDVMIMEPVKGGELVNLPLKAQEIINKLEKGSNASYAIRFAASFDGVIMVLSGMSDLNQMKDNISYMKDFKPLTDYEKQELFKVAEVIKENKLIPCTGCRYCVDGCPKQIKIPDMFSILNTKILNKNYNPNAYKELTVSSGLASDCIKCGLCEKECPQNLPIRELLEKVNKELK